MSWRSVQLGQELCDQDRTILDLFAGKDVNYVGNDLEFRSMLKHNPGSNNLILVFNSSAWLSDIVAKCKHYLSLPVDSFYIGINRYCIKGNDTTVQFAQSNVPGQDIIDVLKQLVAEQGYIVSKSGYYDNDFGRHFNFVQPLTWIYGSKANTSN